ncbi:MAG TPA: AprI/Inh family metalloprotease inhibitor [Rhizomicrobium sp.]
MTRLSALAIGALLAFSTVALAHADETVTGAWKLSIGENDAPCTLTLASDDAAPNAGTATPSADCAGGLNEIGRWKASHSGLQLFSPSGDMVAWLKAKDGAYEGSRLSDGRKLALNR